MAARLMFNSFVLKKFNVGLAAINYLPLQPQEIVLPSSLAHATGDAFEVEPRARRRGRKSGKSGPRARRRERV